MGLAVAAASVLTITPTSPAMAAEGAASGCTPVMAYLVPGTWETSKSADPRKPRGMLASVGEKLKRDYGSSITVLYPNYEASAFDKGKTYAESEREGVERVSALMRQCPDSRNILGGYSQGADAAGDIAWQIGQGRGPVSCTSVEGVGLVADPKRGTNKVVGKQLTGTGISGSRPGGYGCMASKIDWFCAENDKYCNITGKNPLLASLGKTLGSTMNGETDPFTAVGNLVSDFSNVDLAGSTATASKLSKSAQALRKRSPNSTGDASDLATLGSLAGQLVQTFEPILSTQQWVAKTPGARQRLAVAKPGTRAAQANSVLTKLGTMDVQGIVRSASKIAGTVSTALGSSPTVPVRAADETSVSPATTSTPTLPTTTVPDVSTTTSTDETVPTTSGGTTDSRDRELSTTEPGSTTGGLTTSSNADLTGLASTALGLVSQVAPLDSANKQSLQVASSVLGTVRTDTIISQGLNVVSAVVGTDYMGIVNNLALLPQQLFRGDIRGAHRTAGTLNNQFSPWVKMAAQLDFKTASAVVGMIPDPAGYCAIASLVLSLIGNVDIVRLARDVGQIQEVAWSVLETGNLLALTQLLPIGLDLASVAVGVLSPGQKMSADLLGGGATPQQTQLAQATAGQDMSSLFSSVSGLANSQGAKDLSRLVSEGLDAASFFASGVHTDYGKTKVVGNMTALDILYNFFRKALGA